MLKKQAWELDYSEALVLFDFLLRKVDERNGSHLKSAILHDAELWALNGVLGLLERSSVAHLAADYSEQVSHARKAPVAQCGSWPD